MNVSRIALSLLALGFSGCAGPDYVEVRRPAPGGGSYVERVRVESRQVGVKKNRPAPAEVAASEVPAPEPKESRGAGLRRCSSEAQAELASERRATRRKGGWFFGRRPAEPEPAVSYWRGDGVTGRPRMVISLSEQRLRYYRGEQLVGESPVSTGREGFQTVAGRFAICEKDRDHESSLFGEYVDAEGKVVQEDVDVRKDPRPAGTRFDRADMRWFMRITGATGMHAGYLPGFPASHGCIRLPAEMAEIFFRETPLGTLVEIRP